MAYTIEFTDLAKAFAQAKSSLTGLEEQVRGELASIDGLEKPEEVIFHCFEMSGQDFICYGRGEGEGVLVDTATYVESDEPLEKGPFAGKKLQMPMGDSDR